MNANRSYAFWSSRTASRLAFLLGVIVFSFPAPINPILPGIDPSWAAGINVAASRGLVFGQDVIFTYGPLGFALVPVEIGSDSWAWRAIIAHLLLYAAWWVSVGLVLFNLEDPTDWILYAFASSEATFTPENAGVITLTVIGLLVVGLSRYTLAMGALAALISSAALLMKFNVGVACLGTVAIWGLITPPLKKVHTLILRVFVIVFVSLITLVTGFCVLGGSPGGLITFCRESLLISGDYSSQMTLEGPTWQVALLLTFLAAVVAYGVAGKVLGWGTWRNAALIIVPLFFEYKRAITRHDLAHFGPGAVTFAAVMMALLVGEQGPRERLTNRRFCTLSLVICFLSTRRMKALVTLVTLVAVASVWAVAPVVWRRERDGSRWAHAAVLASIMTTMILASLAGGAIMIRKHPKLMRLPHGATHLAAMFDLKRWRANCWAQSDREIGELPPRIVATIGGRRVDVYPTDITLALRNHLNWSPRYLFQSYQAYNPILDEHCANHFRGAEAPDFVIYTRMGTIDDGHQNLVDPKTWLEIYRWYNFEAEDDIRGVGPLLILRRRREPRRWEEYPRVKSRIGIGERWDVPRTGPSGICLKARLELNTWGRLVRTLYRVMPPTMRVEYEDGTQAEYRLVWRNAESGFMIGDLPRDLGAVRAVFQGGTGDRVRAVSFSGDLRFFGRTVLLQWSVFQQIPDEGRAGGSRDSPVQNDRRGGEAPASYQTGTRRGVVVTDP